MWMRMCLFALLSLSAVSASAQAVAPVPLMQTLRGERPIRLQSLSVDTRIRGGLAQTRLRMVFFNPNARALEGNLEFPLLDGQQVVGFALDIDGELRPAVPVEKAKGRQVFEDIERARVDPALLERTVGNNFRLRVFPIPSRGTRTVELRYVESLARQDGDWRYQLPLAYGAIADLDLVLDVDGAAKPWVTGVLGALDFQRAGRAYRTEVKRHDFAASGAIAVRIAASPRAQAFVEQRDDGRYFIAEVPVPEWRGRRALPSRVGLLWDSSGSGARRDIDAELAVLDGYFRALGQAEVRLTRLRDRPEPERLFQVTNGDWSDLRRELQATVYDGASALADWRPREDVEEYLLVSDGLANYGPRAFPALAPGQRLFALDSAPGSDSDRLSALARGHGGRRIAIARPDVAGAVAALLDEGAHVDGVEGSGVADLALETPDPAQGLVRVAGRLLSADATVRLRLTTDGKPRVVEVPIAADAPTHPLAGYLWARYRLASLQGEPERWRGEIRRLGQGFGIATGETSLIVLDRVEDYVRYDIAPPASLAAEFDRLRGEATLRRQQNRDEHLAKVLAAFEQKQDWWQQDFPKGAPPAPEREKTVAPGSMPQPTAYVAEAMAPPPSPAPAPPAIDTDSTDTRTVITPEELRRLPMPRSAESIALLAPGATPPPAEEEEAGPEIAVHIKKWQSDAPYVRRLREASADQLYALYLDEKPSYAQSSGFYLDVADILFEHGQPDLALRVLSNLAELGLEDRRLLRILGYRLLQAKAAALAVPVFEQVRDLAEEEPQSFRDLGLALAAAGRPQEGIDMLYEVAQRPWDGRFADIELIALAELNSIVATTKATLDISAMDPRLVRNLPLDLRVVLAWDADNSDMDLWVTDPNGEKCYYGHKLTYQGGRMSQDFTGGYGPEEFSLRQAKPGKYKVEVNYYGDRQQALAGPTTLQVKLSTGFGTARQRDQAVNLRLSAKSETVLVGEFTVGGP